MELVTGRKGSAHITSQQDRMKHQGVFGEGAYILKTGQMLEPQVQSSNEIRIRDGALMVQGALGCVKVNTYDPVTIQNGSQGMKRIDLICWQYTYDAEQDVESAEWVVIQGTPAESDPQQPAYTDGDIQQGDSPVQVPVFAVELDGINVTGVTTLLPTAPTLEELNSNYIVEEGYNDNGHWRKWSNGTLDMWGIYSFSAANINQAAGAIYYSNAYLITLPFPSLSGVTGISYTVISNGSCWATGATNGDRINNIGWRLEAGIQYSASGGLLWRCTGTWK